MTMNRRTVLAAALSAAALTITAPAGAQGAWPSRPITIIVSYPPGGDTDAVARLFAEKLSTRLGQAVVVDNRPGASGTIGNSYVSKAAPDGYTLLLSPGTLSSAPVVLKAGSGASYDVLQGFTPIIQTGNVPLFLVASAQSGFKSVREVVAAAKAKKQIVYGSPGNGSPMHFVGEMLNKAAGIDLTHSPYKGVGPSVTDVLGGHIPLAWVPLGPVLPHIQAGKMVPLAVALPQRSPLLPNVPSLEEFGYKDIDPWSWQGLMGPKGLPAEVVRTLNAHMNEILKMPDVIAKLNTFGTMAVGGPPERLADSNSAAFQRYSRLVKDFGIQAD
ncbi:MAG TPA: tripartite tricarboxylate transporter substrate binding protein [Ramlibacter sp.]|nr:tripartite tricarboxylate transporter substrate binding protein [Ramlibacter sp.]